MSRSQNIHSSDYKNYYSVYACVLAVAAYLLIKYFMTGKILEDFHHEKKHVKAGERMYY